MRSVRATCALAVFLFGAVAAATAAPPPGSRPVKLKGELEVLYAEDLDQGVVNKLYRLKEQRTGKVYQLKSAKELPADLRSGAIVSVRGYAKNHTVYLGANGEYSLATLVPGVPAVSGVQKTMVVIANYQNATVSCAPSDIANRIFTDPLNKSVDDLYREMSFGSVSLEGDVFGPFTIPYSTTSACNLDAWSQAADAAAAAAGVNVGSYSRKVYYMPQTNPCGYTGIGTLGGNPSRSFIFRCELTDNVAHELGHNLGMDHSSTPTNAYGDMSDIMGYTGLALRQINAPHQKQVGWLASTQYQPVGVAGTYTVAPIELRPDQTTSPQVLLLAKQDTGETYFLSYRQPIGFDANLSATYRTGISVHKHLSGTNATTILLASLADGGVFTDATNGITITQTGHNAQYATVQIGMPSVPVCTPSAPVVSLSPANQSGMPGERRDYVVSVSNQDSPECSAATFALSSAIPSGWSGAVSPASLALLPGAAGSAVLSVTPANAAAADYQVAVVSTSSGGSGSASATATYTVVPDMVAPTAPTGLQAQAGRGVITLSWGAASDNVKVAGYQIWRNGVLFKTATGTSYADKSIVSGTSYTYTVKAFDPSGNVSGSSNAVSAVAVKGNPKTRN